VLTLYAGAAKCQLEMSNMEEQLRQVTKQLATAEVATTKQRTELARAMVTAAGHASPRKEGGGGGGEEGGSETGQGGGGGAGGPGGGDSSSSSAAEKQDDSAVHVGHMRTLLEDCEIREKALGSLKVRTLLAFLSLSSLSPLFLFSLFSLSVCPQLSALKSALNCLPSTVCPQLTLKAPPWCR
jgi:hypothetical protein